MTSEQEIFFEEESTEMLAAILNKIEKLSEENGSEMGILILANVGRLASSVALSFYIKTGDREYALELHKILCDAIWDEAQTYAADSLREE